MKKYVIFYVPWCCRSEHCVSGSPFLISCLLVLLQKHKCKHRHDSADVFVCVRLCVRLCVRVYLNEEANSNR